MPVEVIVPYAGDCPHRARALDWVLGRYPWPVTVAHGLTPWCKAAAVMPAVSASSADVVVLADADVWTDGIHDAVSEVERGAAWAIPHRAVHRLTHQATAAVLTGADWNGRTLAERPYIGLEGGGIVVIPRDLLLTIPMDPRFVGWGQEDTAFGSALRTLLGAPWRGPSPLVHLWHPPQPRLTRRRGSTTSWRLYRRYVTASNDPRLMRALIEEARDALTAAEPAMHDHAA